MSTLNVVFASTMETGDHFKNGASPKSQMSRKIHYTFCAFLMLLLVTSCGVTYVANMNEQMNKQMNKIEYGMSKQAVISILGEPGMRDFNGSLEALQWCNTSGKTHYFVRVWLDSGKVYGVDSYRESAYLYDYCTECFHGINWSTPK